jgi:flagellar biosynthesis/type III secretory pathway protein FliH
VLTRTRIVVVSELARTRDTLLVRLMGARTTLSRAIVDIQALPDDAPERRLALPILVQLRLEITSAPAKQSTIDREFLMNTREVNEYLAALEEKGREEGRKEGRKEGREEGREEALAAVLMAYTTRFGAPPPAFVAAVKRADGPAERQRLLALVITKSAAEIAAEVRKPRAKPAVSKTATRRSAAPRRSAAAR